MIQLFMNLYVAHAMSHAVPLTIAFQLGRDKYLSIDNQIPV